MFSTAAQAKQVTAAAALLWRRTRRLATNPLPLTRRTKKTGAHSRGRKRRFFLSSQQSALSIQ